MSNLHLLNLKETLVGLKNKEFSSFELTSSCIERIKEVDTEVKAYLTLNFENALTEAKKADEIISNRGEEAFKEFPLLGVPYALKDNFSTKGIRTTASPFAALDSSV